MPGDLTAPVDWVAVPPGRGALVEALAGPTATEGPLAVVSDLGQRFPLASREVLVPLGYASVRPVRLPAAVVALLPAGRTLDPAAALHPGRLIAELSTGASTGMAAVRATRYGQRRQY